MPITDKHPDTPTTTSENSNHTFLSKAEQSRAYLYIGGLLSVSENNKIKARIIKWCKKFQGKEVETK